MKKVDDDLTISTIPLDKNEIEFSFSKETKKLTRLPFYKLEELRKQEEKKLKHPHKVKKKEDQLHHPHVHPTSHAMKKKKTVLKKIKEEPREKENGEKEEGHGNGQGQGQAHGNGHKNKNENENFNGKLNQLYPHEIGDKLKTLKYSVVAPEQKKMKLSRKQRKLQEAENTLGSFLSKEDKYYLSKNNYEEIGQFHKKNSFNSYNRKNSNSSNINLNLNSGGGDKLEKLNSSGNVILIGGGGTNTTNSNITNNNNAQNNKGNSNLELIGKKRKRLNKFKKAIYKYRFQKKQFLVNHLFNLNKEDDKIGEGALKLENKDIVIEEIEVINQEKQNLSNNITQIVHPTSEIIVDTLLKVNAEEKPKLEKPKIKLIPKDNFNIIPTQRNQNETQNNFYNYYNTTLLNPNINSNQQANSTQQNWSTQLGPINQNTSTYYYPYNYPSPYFTNYYPQYHYAQPQHNFYAFNNYYQGLQGNQSVIYGNYPVRKEDPSVYTRVNKFNNKNDTENKNKNLKNKKPQEISKQKSKSVAPQTQNNPNLSQSLPKKAFIFETKERSNSESQKKTEEFINFLKTNHHLEKDVTQLQGSDFQACVENSELKRINIKNLQKVADENLVKEYIKKFEGVQPEININNKFIREYVDQILDKELDKKFGEFIVKMREIYFKKKATNPLKAKKRFVVGMREVEKQIKLEESKCVFMIPNIEKVEGENSLDERLIKIFKDCERLKVPIIFGLNKFKLGKLARKKNSAVSILSFINVEGFEREFRDLLEFCEKFKKMFYQKYNDKRELFTNNKFINPTLFDVYNSISNENN